MMRAVDRRRSIDGQVEYIVDQIDGLGPLVSDPQNLCRGCVGLVNTLSVRLMKYQRHVCLIYEPSIRAPACFSCDDSVGFADSDPVARLVINRRHRLRLIDLLA